MKISFRGKVMDGKLVEQGSLYFLKNIAKIDVEKYDRIYNFDNGFAGAYLLIRGDHYDYFQCGSGVPGGIVETGSLQGALSKGLQVLDGAK
jgi:hypothetical protein